MIGPYIRQKRLDKGWTQEYLCDGICTAPTLSRIETNDRTPSSSVLKALLEKLGFHREGLALRYLKIQGQWEDHIHLAKLAD